MSRTRVLRLSLRLLRREDSRFPYSEQALLAEMTPKTAHADALAKPTASEFGD